MMTEEGMKEEGISMNVTIPRTFRGSSVTLSSFKVGPKIGQSWIVHCIYEMVSRVDGLRAYSIKFDGFYSMDLHGPVKFTQE